MFIYLLQILTRSNFREITIAKFDSFDYQIHLLYIHVCTLSLNKNILLRIKKTYIKDYHTNILCVVKRYNNKMDYIDANMKYSSSSSSDKL